MLPYLPLYMPIAFILITLLALGFVTLLINTASKSVSRNTFCQIIAIIIAWLVLQASLSYLGIYSQSPEAIPPRIILLGVLPPIIAILILFITRQGKLFIDRMSMQMLTYVHLIRIPVELVLYGLFLNGTIPELMTFEGRNLDILAGITAPIVGFLGISQHKMGKTTLLLWNFICLGLLLNIIVTAILSAPSPFQQLAFAQPNIAILYFPFSWLPVFVVPLVLFAHLAAIRKLISNHLP